MPHFFLLAAIAFGADRYDASARGDRIEISIPAGMDQRIGSLAVVRGARWVTLVDEMHHFASFRPGVRRVGLWRSRQMGAYAGDEGTDRRVNAFAGRGGVSDRVCP